MSERGKNAVAIGVALIAFVALAAFAYRPATVIGIQGGVLAASLGGDSSSDCQHGEENRWYCSDLPDASGSGSVSYFVTTKSRMLAFVPSAVVTLMGPLLAPDGTVA